MYLTNMILSDPKLPSILFSTNYFKAAKMSAKIWLASGNFSLRGGPLANPDQTWTCLASLVLPMEISNEPRRGFPPSFSFRPKACSGASSHNSLWICAALRLNTDHEVQCSMKTIGPFPSCEFTGRSWADFAFGVVVGFLASFLARAG